MTGQSQKQTRLPIGDEQKLKQETRPGHVPVRLLRDMLISYGGSSWRAQCGQIIEDYGLCQYLFNTNALVAPITETDIAACQNCNIKFKLSEQSKHTGTVLVCLADFKTSFNGSMIVRKKGEIESDPFLVKFMLDGKAPVAIASNGEYARCPKCKLAFPIVHLLGDLMRTNHLTAQRAIS